MTARGSSHPRASTAKDRARCKAIGDQIARATHDKIRLMKEGELARANTDFGRRIAKI